MSIPLNRQMLAAKRSRRFGQVQPLFHCHVCGENKRSWHAMGSHDMSWHALFTYHSRPQPTCQLEFLTRSQHVWTYLHGRPSQTISDPPEKSNLVPPWSYPTSLPYLFPRFWALIFFQGCLLYTTWRMLAPFALCGKISLHCVWQTCMPSLCSHPWSPTTRTPWVNIRFKYVFNEENLNAAIYVWASWRQCSATSSLGGRSSLN